MPTSTLSKAALARRLLIAAALFGATPMACGDSAGSGGGGSNSGGAADGGSAEAGGADGGHGGAGGGSSQGGGATGGGGANSGGSTSGGGGSAGGSGGSGGVTGIPGRAFVVEGVARRANVDRLAERNWTAARAFQPAVGDLSVQERDELARAWANDGAYEHASVASFAKFSLELMAFGAPPALVAAAHRAALDEIEHASIALSLASAYAGANLEPGALGEAAHLTLASSIEAMVSAVVIEGCVGETLAALVALAQRSVATDPEVRRALDVIAEDEARHAELAYATVAWAIATFGAPAREAARAAFDRATAAELEREPSAEGAIPAHGRLSGLEIAAERANCLSSVVRPSIERMLEPASPEILLG